MAVWLPWSSSAALGPFYPAQQEVLWDTPSHLPTSSGENLWLALTWAVSWGDIEEYCFYLWQLLSAPTMWGTSSYCFVVLWYHCSPAILTDSSFILWHIDSVSVSNSVPGVIMIVYCVYLLNSNTSLSTVYHTTNAHLYNLQFSIPHVILIPFFLFHSRNVHWCKSICWPVWTCVWGHHSWSHPASTSAGHQHCGCRWRITTIFQVSLSVFVFDTSFGCIDFFVVISQKSVYMWFAIFIYLKNNISSFAA